MSWSELFPITKEDEEEILRINGVTKKQEGKHVTILEDWYRKQQHFPKTYPYHHFLRRALSMSEFNVEATKRKIEVYSTLKNVYRDIYEALFNVDDKIMMPTEMCCMCVPMPKLGPKKQRIFVSEMKTSDVSKFDMKHCEELLILCIELGTIFDKITSVIIVIDCRNTAVGMISKIDYSKLIKLTNLMMNAYEPDVIEAIHLLNLNKGTQLLLNIFKKIVHNKIMDRVHIHSKLESLYEYVPREYLPEEHGGTQGSMSKLVCLMDEVLLENKQYLLDLPKFAADDSLRLGENHYNNMFGSDGMFSKLNID